MRIVTLPPGATDLVRALGLGAQIVGGVGDRRGRRPAGGAGGRSPAAGCPPPGGGGPPTRTSRATSSIRRPWGRGSGGDPHGGGVPRLRRGVHPPGGRGRRGARGSRSQGGRCRWSTSRPGAWRTPWRLSRRSAALLGQAERGQAFSRARGPASWRSACTWRGTWCVAVAHAPRWPFCGRTGSGWLPRACWYPDLVDAAGGVPLLAQAGGEDVPLTPAQVGAAGPELVVVGAETLARPEAAVGRLRPADRCGAGLGPAPGRPLHPCRPGPGGGGGDAAADHLPGGAGRQRDAAPARPRPPGSGSQRVRSRSAPGRRSPGRSAPGPRTARCSACSSGRCTALPGAARVSPGREAAPTNSSRRNFSGR